MPRIVVIDDDPDLVATLRLGLTNAGYEVATTTNGFDGVAAVRAAPTHAVLTDIYMPYGGLPTIRVLRAEFPSLPIIAISAAEGRLQRAAQLGAVRILQKPFAFADLIPLLAETLGEKKDGDEMGAGGRNA